jgi:hypothetical protein
VSRYAPTFSWTFSSPDQADPTGDRQTAFQIRIGTSPGASDVWDSLKRTSGSTAVQYGSATELSPNTTYYWSVRAWNRYDLAGSYSGVGAFAILDIGLRVFDGVETVRIAVDYAGADTPLRISKDGVTYGILLVDPSDPRASRLRIMTMAGIKAFKKM